MSVRTMAAAMLLGMAMPAVAQNPNNTGGPMAPPPAPPPPTPDVGAPPVDAGSLPTCSRMVVDKCVERAAARTHKRPRRHR